MERGKKKFGRASSPDPVPDFDEWEMKRAQEMSSRGASAPARVSNDHQKHSSNRGEGGWLRGWLGPDGSQDGGNDHHRHRATARIRGGRGARASSTSRARSADRSKSPRRASSSSPPLFLTRAPDSATNILPPSERYITVDRSYTPSRRSSVTRHASEIKDDEDDSLGSREVDALLPALHGDTLSEAEMRAKKKWLSIHEYTGVAFYTYKGQKIPVWDLWKTEHRFAREAFIRAGGEDALLQAASGVEENL